MVQNIRFVDLDTGNTFDGSSPYVFWIDGEQSTNIIYSKPICFISNSRMIEVKLEKNDIFSLIDHKSLINKELESIYDFEYHDINKLKCDYLKSVGTRYAEYYIHIIYIVACSAHPGECLTDFYIDNNKYTIGADFYTENEELYINLSNNGVEIPNSIQKAIYGTNVHEENYDNILLNRKWKELLSNTWDVLANKGSYKSLFNSLEWFEYGDKIKLSEVWKNPTNNTYFIKDIQQILDDKFSFSMNEFNKTTYLALYYALEQPKKVNGVLQLDKEKNPELQQVTSKWSVQDLALKLCMLGNFYETYFMPIHTDLIHSTIEDVVYTNTYKTYFGSIFERSDYVYLKDDIHCNVKDGDIFRLNKVSFQVGPDTLFGQKDINSTNDIIGVQITPVDKLSTNEDWKQFSKQYYNEIGSIINFSIQLPLNKDDMIKREVLVFKSKNNKGGWDSKNIIEYKILESNISFDLFCPCEGEYEVKLQFDSIGGNVYTKVVKFSVIDTNSTTINIYKIQNKQLLNDNDIELLNKPHKLNEFSLSRRSVEYNQESLIYKQYIPAFNKNIYSDQFKWTGVALNHLLILKTTDEYVINVINSQTLNRFYFVITKNNKYAICISKIFGFKPSDNVSMLKIYNDISSYIYREDYIFMPEFHKLVSLSNDKSGVENIKDYTVTDEDTLCVMPNLSYGKHIEEYDWEFINMSRPWEEPIKLNYIKEPFITNLEKSPLTPGYYTIKFKYRLTNENKINTIVLDSAFKKV